MRRKPGPHTLLDVLPVTAGKGFFYCELPLSLNFVGIYSNVIFPRICGKNYSVSQGTSAAHAEGNQISLQSVVSG